MFPTKIIIPSISSPSNTEMPLENPLQNQSHIKKTPTAIGKTISKGVNNISVLIIPLKSSLSFFK